MTSFRQLLQSGRRELAVAGLENGFREAGWLLETAGDRPLSELLLCLDQQAPVQVCHIYQGWVKRRCLGEPLQHIIAKVDFCGFELRVGPGVLIPRPETECLVELALNLYPGHGMVCDVCTGSAAIALVLARQLPGRPIVVGSDISAEALAYAEDNRKRHRVDNLYLVQANLFRAINRQTEFSMVTANPPYVGEEEYPALPEVVRKFDPASALLAGDSGLAMIRRVVMEARSVLQADGWLVCEIAETQARAVLSIMDKAGYEKTGVENDLTGRARITFGKLKR